MKLSNFAAPLMIGLITLSVLPSCSSESEEPTTIDRGSAKTIEFPSGMIYVTSSENPEGVLIPATCFINYYEKDTTADLRIKGATMIGDRIHSIDETYESIPYKGIGHDQLGFVTQFGIDTVDIAQFDGSTIKSIYTVTTSEHNGLEKRSNFSLMMKSVGQTASYPYQYERKIIYFPYKTVAYGTTRVTGPGSSKINETDKITYEAVLAQDGTAKLLMRNVRFDENMPEIDEVVFSGLKVTYGEKSCVITTDDYAIPTVDGVPYPKFAISHLKYHISADSPTSWIIFSCDADSQYIIKYTVFANTLDCRPSE